MYILSLKAFDAFVICEMVDATGEWHIHTTEIWKLKIQWLLRTRNTAVIYAQVGIYEAVYWFDANRVCCDICYDRSKLNLKCRNTMQTGCVIILTSM